MPTDQIFRRVVWYGLLLSAVDAVSGRLLQAAPDPSVVLSLGATAWVAYRLAETKATRRPFLAAMTLFIVYIAAFVLWARLLVGWNGSVPWRPRSVPWGAMFVISAPIIALIAQCVGRHAGTRAGAKAANEAISHDR